MKLEFWRLVMSLAFTIDGYADEFLEWSRQKYCNEFHGIGRIE